MQLANKTLEVLNCFWTEVFLVGIDHVNYVSHSIHCLINPFTGVASLLNYAQWAGLSSSPWMDPTSYGVDETRLQVTQVQVR